MRLSKLGLLCTLAGLAACQTTSGPPPQPLEYFPAPVAYDGRDVVVDAILIVNEPDIYSPKLIQGDPATIDINDICASLCRQILRHTGRSPIYIQVSLGGDSHPLDDSFWKVVRTPNCVPSEPDKWHLHAQCYSVHLVDRAAVGLEWLEIGSASDTHYSNGYFLQGYTVTASLEPMGTILIRGGDYTTSASCFPCDATLPVSRQGDYERVQGSIVRLIHSVTLR